jgi:DNA-binding PadR family transcriptional regulator
VREPDPVAEPALSSIERRILLAGLALMPSGSGAFHGYQMAQSLAGGPTHLPSVGYGTLYRAFDRLERIGYLSSWWAEPVLSNGPRRRMYKLTPVGVGAVTVAPSRALGRSRGRVTACT